MRFTIQAIAVAINIGHAAAKDINFLSDPGVGFSLEQTLASIVTPCLRFMAQS
jgi:hypothetical protein